MHKYSSYQQYRLIAIDSANFIVLVGFNLNISSSIKLLVSNLKSHISTALIAIITGLGNSINI